jgi:hypothetical protein
MVGGKKESGWLVDTGAERGWLEERNKVDVGGYRDRKRMVG